MRQTYKQLMAFIHKEFLHVFRDRRTLLIMFGLPIVQILIFGFALTNEVKNARLLVVDPSHDMRSEQITQKIKASSYFSITHIESNTKNMDAYFKNGEIQCAVIFPLNFASSSLETAKVQFVSDASDPNFAKTVVNYLSAIISDYILQSNLIHKAPIRIETEVKMLYNPSLNGSMNFVPGVIALIMMIVCTTLTSVSVVREKESGTMEVFLVSPLKPILVLISKAIPYFVLSMLNLTVILVISNLILDVPIRGSLILLVFESFLFILTCLSLGLLISNITASQAVAMLASMGGILLPTLLFTGFLFPLENMPLVFQWIANIVPARWFFLIAKSIMLKGLCLTDLWFETSILVIMTIVLLAISLRKFKIRLQ